MSVTKENWGSHDGYAVKLFTLKNDNLTVRLTNFGAALVGIDVPDKNKVTADVVLGYDNLEGYVNGKSFQGAVIGRYANRVGGAAFILNGQKYRLSKNDGDNCLHGGTFGYNRRVWEYEPDEKKNSVTFLYRSPDGEEGFPAALNISVKYTLTDKNKLKIKYEAVSDGDTIFNPTNHAYFNLKGKESVLDTVLQINALNYTPFDEFNIPAGEIESVPGTAFNFLKPKKIGADIESGKIDGYDHNFLLGEAGEMKKAAVAHEPESGRIMAVYTDMPAIQLYTANGLSETGKGGVHFGRHHAFCLETQFTPNTPNLPGFPSCILKKGRKFKSTTVYAFGVK
ncbi:MAG: galactose mutarotase [Oscillospiraceae bacterium]|jgi:aldose 1-epimerase|nr:galactose mutarotase [Oscillospiraceae bacterium]